jgi:hypothetical protein
MIRACHEGLKHALSAGDSTRLIEAPSHLHSTFNTAVLKEQVQRTHDFLITWRCFVMFQSMALILCNMELVAVTDSPAVVVTDSLITPCSGDD